MSESFTAYLRELFSELGPVVLRKMFGGQGLYHQGLIIGLVIGDELYLKTDALTVAAFEQAGGHPFVYEGKGKPVKISYWQPPADAMESSQGMHSWAKLAYEAAVRKHAGKKPAPARTSGARKVAGRRPVGSERKG